MSLLRHLCLLLLLGLTSCTYFETKFRNLKLAREKKSAADKRLGEAKVIGVIELVNPEQNYVLINCDERVDIPAGTEVISQGVHGTDAKLKVTPERKGNYITADITEGVPQLRDLVVYQVKGAAAAAAPTTTTPAGVVVPLTPVMKADVIPPLNAPFQPLPSGQPYLAPASAPPPFLQAPSPSLPPPPSQAEPVADPSKLPPVIR